MAYYCPIMYLVLWTQWSFIQFGYIVIHVGCLRIKVLL